MIGALVTFLAVMLAAALAGIGYVVRTLSELKAGQATITAQYANNGGKSMRDAIDRIEANQDRVEAGQAVASDKLNNHLIESARVWARVDALAGQSHVTVNTGNSPEQQHEQH